MIKPSSRPIIHKRLYSEMISQGYDYNSLADRSQVSDRTIYAIVHGETNPRIDTALLIARALGRSLDYLYPLYEHKEKATV